MLLLVRSVVVWDDPGVALHDQLSRDAYDAVQQLPGDAGIVELVLLCGYYTLVSFLLNAFALPLPPGAAPQWGESG
jgi:hypothetical protein